MSGLQQQEQQQQLHGWQNVNRALASAVKWTQAVAIEIVQNLHREIKVGVWTTSRRCRDSLQMQLRGEMQ